MRTLGESVLAVVSEAAEAGVTGFVVVSSGFAETGPEGARQQSSLRRIAEEAGLTLLGPNALGFINYVDGVPLSVLERENQRGHFAIASVSGSVGAYLASICHQQGVGLSHLILAGNEAHTNIADVLEFLIEDPETRSIGVFLEAVYDPERFARAAERALRAHKPIVLLKAGAAQPTARLAAAHTGALVGDDRVFDAVAREMGICRVDSYEDLITTATLLQRTGPVAKPGIAAITVSGGSGEILSDLAGSAGVSFPPFAPETRRELDALVSGFGQAFNPLDLTGAALRDPGLWERCLAAIAKDETIGLALCLWDVPVGGEPEWALETFRSIVRGYRAFPVVPPLLAPVVVSITPPGQRMLTEAGLPGAVYGLKPTVQALSQLARWSRRALDPRPVALFRANANQAPPSESPRGEREILDWLADHGVPVTPGLRAADADGAVRAATELGYPVALKLSATLVRHKSEVGGVRLGLSNPAAVHAAFDAIVGADVGAARIEGVIVSPMRAHDLELLVAVTCDPVWGAMLTIGLGGVWVEVFADIVVLPLPADRERVIAALRDLKAAPLFAGVRGRRAIPLEGVADVIVGIARAAGTLGSHLVALEVNPLAVSPERTEAMDALTLWA